MQCQDSMSLGHGIKPTALVAIHSRYFEILNLCWLLIHLLVQSHLFSSILQSPYIIDLKSYSSQLSDSYEGLWVFVLLSLVDVG